MKPRFFVLGASGVLALGAMAYATWELGQASTRSSGTDDSAATGLVPSPRAAEAALLASPQAQDYQQRLAFQERARYFFAQSERLRPDARQQQAQHLQAEIDRYERDGMLSAGEAIVLRLGLVQATQSDPARQAELMAELVARYRTDADRRTRAFQAAQRHDPAFNDYKHREARVVAEVMAMQSFPNGLTRDQYLRQRLQRERELAYQGP